MSDSPAVLDHPHNPELRHHFADMEQQKHAASLGMWLFLGTEVMFFGGMFLAYLIYRRWYYPEFVVASNSLNQWLGAVNTAVLICSSLSVALAIRAAQTNKRMQTVIMLVLTLVFGLAFLGVKAVEWKEKFTEHHVPGSTFHFEGTMPGHPETKINPEHAQVFFSMYFAMTGMHALHMIIGVGIFLWLINQAWKGRFNSEYYTPLENSGLYWHFVDVIWIYLFPLFYLIDRHK